MKQVMIGVAGGAASGKTTVAKRLKTEFQESVQVISHEWYYLPHDELSYEERCRLNYDHPNAFDNDLFYEQLESLKNGHAVQRPVYDFDKMTRSKKTVTIEPEEVMIVDGILIYADPRIRNLMDIKVFVDTDADERVLRRILRDVSERGKNLEEVISQYLMTVKPMHEMFVEPSKRYADVIIPKGGENNIAIDMLVRHIHSLLED